MRAMLAIVMQRVNVMISDEAKIILVRYQAEKKLTKQDDALDALIKESEIKA
jgi:hypothetical protein